MFNVHSPYSSQTASTVTSCTFCILLMLATSPHTRVDRILETVLKQNEAINCTSAVMFSTNRQQEFQYEPIRMQHTHTSPADRMDQDVGAAAGWRCIQSEFQSSVSVSPDTETHTLNSTQPQLYIIILQLSFYDNEPWSWTGCRGHNFLPSRL